MSETDNSRLGKIEALVEELVAQSQAQQERQVAMMEMLDKLTQAFHKSQSATKDTIREETIDRSTLKQVSEIVAGIQGDVVHGEEKVADIVRAIEETTVTPITGEADSAHEEDAQKHVSQNEFQEDLNKAETEFNKIEAFNQAMAAQQQKQEHSIEAISNGVKHLAELTESRIDTIASEVQTLKVSMAEVQESQMNAGSSNSDTTRVPPVGKHTGSSNTCESIQAMMSRETQERLHIIQRNMETLILDENDELLARCTKEYAEVDIDIPCDKWITRHSDLEQELLNMQRQLVTTRVRFEDWNFHLSLLCDNELSHAIRGEDGHLLPWPQAVCEILRDIDFRDRSFQIMNELWITWPQTGELLRPFFQKFFSRAHMVTDFSIFPLCSWRVQQIICKRWPSPADRKKIQDLDCLLDLQEFVRNYVPSMMTYDGSHA